MDEQHDALQWEHERIDGGKVKVLVRWRGDVMHADNLDPASATARKRFVKELTAKAPAAKPEDIEAELLRLAAAPAGDGQANEQADPHGAATALLNEMPQNIRDDASALLTDPMLIKRVIDDVAALNVAGERELVATVFLIGVSRLLARPLAAIVQG